MWDRSKREETEGNEQRIVIKQEIEEFKWRTSREREREREREITIATPEEGELIDSQ